MECYTRIVSLPVFIFRPSPRYSVIPCFLTELCKGSKTVHYSEIIGIDGDAVLIFRVHRNPHPLKKTKMDVAVHVKPIQIYSSLTDYPSSQSWQIPFQSRRPAHDEVLDRRGGVGERQSKITQLTYAGKVIAK